MSRRHWLSVVLLCAALLTTGVYAQSAVTEQEPTLQPQKPLTPGDFNSDQANFYLQKVKPRAPRADQVKAELEPHQRQFIERYERVKWYKDADMLEEIIHPASKACENDKNADYFHYIRQFYLNETLPREYHLQLMPVAEDKQWALKERLDFPLPPTHLLYMEYKDGEFIEGLQRFLREEEYPEKRLYEIIKCPDAETLEQFHQQQDLVDFSEAGDSTAE